MVPRVLPTDELKDLETALREGRVSPDEARARFGGTLDEHFYHGDDLGHFHKVRNLLEPHPRQLLYIGDDDTHEGVIGYLAKQDDAPSTKMDPWDPETPRTVTAWHVKPLEVVSPEGDLPPHLQGSNSTPSPAPWTRPWDFQGSDGGPRRTRLFPFTWEMNTTREMEAGGDRKDPFTEWLEARKRMKAATQDDDKSKKEPSVLQEYVSNPDAADEEAYTLLLKTEPALWSESARNFVDRARRVWTDLPRACKEALKEVPVHYADGEDDAEALAMMLEGGGSAGPPMTLEELNAATGAVWP